MQMRFPKRRSCTTFFPSALAKGGLAVRNKNGLTTRTPRAFGQECAPQALQYKPRYLAIPAFGARTFAEQSYNVWHSPQQTKVTHEQKNWNYRRNRTRRIGAGSALGGRGRTHHPWFSRCQPRGGNSETFARPARPEREDRRFRKRRRCRAV